MKPVQTLILVIALIIICVGGTSFYFMQNNPAATTSNPVASKKLITKLINNKGIILNTFKSGPFLGYIVKGSQANAPEGILFTDAAGKFVISGNIINGKLKNLTQEAAAKYITPAKAKKAFNMIDTTNYVVDGTNAAPHKMYAIADPNCIYCHRFYQAARPLVKAGKLQIRWIIGAFLKPSSKGKAAAILSAANPAKALLENENKFNEKIEEGGITPLSKIPSSIEAKLKANMQFMVKNQIMQTPTLLYKNANGTPKIFSGVPQGKKLEILVNSMSNKF